MLKLMPFVLSVGLLLAGCQPQSQATPTPSQDQASVFGNGLLYQLTMHGGDQRPTAQISSQRLTTQASEPFSAPLQFSGPLSTASFIDTQTRTWHVRATFKVTNNTARTRGTLMFLPAVLTDADGDPTNNINRPTIRDTPFHSIRLFDGSDASSQAERLIPTRGKTFNAQTGLTEADPLTNLFIEDRSAFTDIDASAIPFPPVPGLSLKVKNSGWLFNLPQPGTSRNVTFAFDMQNIDLAQSSKLPYNFTLVFEVAEETMTAESYLRNVVTASESYRADSNDYISTPTTCSDARITNYMGISYPEEVKTCMVVQTQNATYAYVTTTNNISYQYNGMTVVRYTPATFPANMP